MITGDDLYRLYGGKIESTNVPLEMIEDYTRLYPSLKVDWTNFEELRRDESRKSKMFSVYNKTMKTNENLSHHPLEKLADLLKQPSTIDDPYKYQPDQSINAEVQSIIEIDGLNVVQSVDSTRKYYILLDRTNFYATAGGQSSDRGIIQFPHNLSFHVE